LTSTLAVAALVTWSFPVRLLLERGQVDGLTLLLVSGCVLPLARGRDSAAGVSLALATLLKLNAVLLAAFLLLRRRPRALAGLLGGIALLLAASALLNGRTALSDYALVQLPRISAYGEVGPDLLDAETLRRLRAGVPEGFTRKAGRLYRSETTSFVANASLARA